jgi:DNA topoisomerase VI subunit B
MQIGHSPNVWPVALLKELIDNALDACETVNTPPVIHVKLDTDGFSVTDNGPGLPVDILRRSLDYTVRVSDKAHYVSPTRGQLGNALKCLWAAPYVWTEEYGRIDVSTAESTYRVDVKLDRIAQEPQVTLTETGEAVVKKGTSIKVYWPGASSLLRDGSVGDFYKRFPDAATLLRHYAAFNPHAAFTLADGHGLKLSPTAETVAKWQPSDPTSPHWYTVARLQELIAAYLHQERAGGRARTVREFVSEFRGLSATGKQKAVTQAAGLSGAWLRDLIDGDSLSAPLTDRLLTAMQAESRLVKPDALGVLGEAHLSTWLERDAGVGRESVRYKKVDGLADGLPFVLEVAFGVYRGDCDEFPRSLAVGLNWTPALASPLSELTQMLGEYRVDGSDPVAVAVHLACPRLDFTDRGKSRLALPDPIRAALSRAIDATCKAWKQKKRQADREDRVRERELDELRRAQRRETWSLKEAAYAVMKDAYEKASENLLGGPRYPANARQIMYKARPGVLALTGGKSWKNSQYFTQTWSLKEAAYAVMKDAYEKASENLLGGPRYPANARQIMYKARPGVLALTGGKSWKNSQYFTQSLLIGYLEDNPDETAAWDVVFDDRGHFTEPHTGRSIGLGTLAVRQYTGLWRQDIDDMVDPELTFDVGTHGPANRYRYALFIEKEGFAPLLKSAQIAERYDLAIFSTKGLPVTASRQLAERLAEQGVTILVLHDFDKAGFSILHTLSHDNRRYRYRTRPRVIDLGLRLADVQGLGLESERVEYKDKADPAINLARNGAKPDELRYLVKGRQWSAGGYWGERVELNAMTSAQFITWLEAKLEKVGVQKVVPTGEALKNAHRKAARHIAVQKAIDKALAELEDTPPPMPDDLEDRIRQAVTGTAEPWEDVLLRIVDESPPPTCGHE